ncbi:hypothetical protein PUN28_013926 [Cardiocondyla obscurior]|uniref:Uncharacterized protein n=1 Tax=Cardiocondyla obscurior TaxID=286306 RepID=A0AAW2F8Z4_9HYME
MPREVTPEPPKLRTERSWSPLPSVPPNSPISHEDLETEENTPGRTPSPSRPRSTSPLQPDPELFRPTTPSYTPDVSLNSRATPDHNILIYYPGVEHPFLAPIRLIDRVFPRSTARITEIIEINLE